MKIKIRPDKKRQVEMKLTIDELRILYIAFRPSATFKKETDSLSIAFDMECQMEAALDRY